MWIAAASKLQRAWRVHTLRQGLQRAPALRRARLRAVTRVQALWRGRPARLAFLTRRAAAVKLQVSVSSMVTDYTIHECHPLLLPGAYIRPWLMHILPVCDYCPSRHSLWLQACIRGWRDRRWVMHNITVPRILRQCLVAKQTLQHIRWATETDMTPQCKIWNTHLHSCIH